jgi:hypothetical protein
MSFIDSLKASYRNLSSQADCGSYLTFSADLHEVSQIKTGMMAADIDINTRNMAKLSTVKTRLLAELRVRGIPI